jgi:hypothetical protein
MPDNVTASAGSGGPVFATALGTWSGDATANFPGCFLAIVSGSEGSWSFAQVVGGAGAVSAGVQRVTLASDDPAVVALQVLDNAIAGNEMQVDIVGELPAGTNNIGDVDIASIAAGDNNIGNVDIVTVPADPFGANADAASATGSISAKLRFIASTGIPITGTTVVGDGGGSITVDNAGTFATQAAAAGDVAHDGADSGAPIKVGFKATTSLSGLTLVANSDRTNGFAGVDGVPIVRQHTNLEDIVTGLAAITDGSSTSVIASAGAGVKIYITEVIIANSSATAVTVDLRDGTGGSVKATFSAPAGSGCHKTLSVPIPFSAATAVAADPSAAASTVTVTLVGFKSKV